MSINVPSIVDCVTNLLANHDFGVMLGPNVVVTGESHDYFMDINPYATTEYKPVIHVSFDGYRANNRGEGSVSHRICYYATTDRCHECFFYFALSVASCCNGLTLTSVSRPDYHKPVYKVCATYTTPISQCSMCPLEYDDDDQDDDDLL